MDIYITGNTNAKTRLYRMAIGINLDELSKTFDVYAITNGEWVFFTKNMEITAFVIKRKSELFNQVSTYTVNEELNKYKNNVFDPKKLEEANRTLKSLKTPLPK